MIGIKWLIVYGFFFLYFVDICFILVGVVIEVILWYIDVSVEIKEWMVIFVWVVEWMNEFCNGVGLFRRRVLFWKLCVLVIWMLEVYNRV